VNDTVRAVDAAEAQVTQWTRRIDGLVEHLRLNPADAGSRHELLVLVGRRRRAMRGLRSASPRRYGLLVRRLIALGGRSA
jgi:ribosomal protein S15